MFSHSHCDEMKHLTKFKKKNHKIKCGFRDVTPATSTTGFIKDVFLFVCLYVGLLMLPFI